MASRSAYRSRSTFDDPAGIDSSFNSGRAIGGIVHKRDFLEAFSDIAQKAIPDYWRQQKKKGFSDKSGVSINPPVRVNAGPMVRYGKKRSRSSSTGASKRRKLRGRVRSAGRRVRFASRSRSRSRGFRRRVAGLRKRFKARRRYVYGSKKSVASFKRMISMNAATSPVNLSTEFAYTLANIGNSTQNKCSWFCWATCRPGDLDTVLAACSNDVITNVPAQYKAYIQRITFSSQFKNASNHRTDITVYKLYPRRDIPAAYGDMTGLNPTFLQGAFSNLDASSAAVRLKAYNEHGADPYESLLPTFYRIKKILRKFMEPGQFFTVVSKIRNKVVSKSQFGLQVTNSSIASQWDYLKRFGPLYLVRAQGPIVHDEAKGVLPIVDSATGGPSNAYDVTPGSYAVDVFTQRHYRLIGSDIAASNNTPQYGMTSLAMPAAITNANEKTYEAVRPDDDVAAY